MFDLEKEIEAWRARFLKGKRLSARALDELEQHLRDSFDAISREKSEVEAFREAVALLGEERRLCEEFKKDERLYSRDHLVMLGGQALLLLASLGIVGFGARFWLSQNGDLLALHAPAMMIAYLSLHFLGAVSGYSVLRAILLKSEDAYFNFLYAKSCGRFCIVALLGTSIAFASGMIYSFRMGNALWQWHSSEAKCFAVGLASLGFIWLCKSQRLSGLRLAQAGLAFSMLGFLAAAASARANVNLVLHLVAPAHFAVFLLSYICAPDEETRRSVA